MVASQSALLVQGRTPSQSIRIPKQSGTAFVVEAGALVRLIDVEGEQVADLVAFGHPDRSIKLSTDETREVARSLNVTVGDGLYDLEGTRLLTIVADDVGRHDLLFPWCRPEMYRRIYGQETHPSCFENFSIALSPLGIQPVDIPMPFNVFQNVVIHDDGRMEVRRPLSKPGESIVLRAERDLVIAVTACSVDQSACNGFSPSPIHVEVYDLES